MAVHIEYNKFKASKEPVVPMEKLYENEYELGRMQEAFFGGFKEDIRKVAEICGITELVEILGANNEEIENNEKIYSDSCVYCYCKKINGIILYELSVRPFENTSKKDVLCAMEKVPSCKVAIYFCSKWDCQTVGSDSGYPFLTYKPRFPEYHAKEDDEAWERELDPNDADIGWNELDYVIEKDGTLMQMSTTAKEGNVEVVFIEGGAKVINIFPQKNIVNIPETVKGEAIIDFQYDVFDKKDIEIRCPFIPITEWKDKKSKKAVVLGYARGLQENIAFHPDVIKKNNRYIKSQRKKLLEFAATDESLLQLMTDKMMLDIEDVQVLMEEVTKQKNVVLTAMLLEYSEKEAIKKQKAKFEEEQLQKALEYDPFSPSELKKIWKTRKMRDGSLKIVSYMGTETTIIVPNKIGEQMVSIIGAYAFSPEQKEKNKVEFEEVAEKLQKEKEKIRKKIRSIQLPEGLITIEEHAFAECNSLKSMIIPSGVSNIGQYVFKNCSKLKEVSIPESVVSISGNSFYGCSKLKSINKKDMFIHNGVLKRYLGTEKEVSIPDGICAIDDCAFENCNKLEKVIIPESVSAIGAYAFDACSNLKEVVIPERVKSIGEGAFECCSNLKEIVMPAGLISIGAFAFAYCGLREVIIPRGVRMIMENTFVESDLEKVIISESVETIAEYAFGWCTNLKEVIIPEGVRTIEKCAFADTNLEKVIIPESVEKIGELAFGWCVNLSEVIFPDYPENLDALAEDAFMGCDKLPGMPSIDYWSKEIWWN